MTYDEIRRDPEIKWTQSPVVGLTMMLTNHGMIDSFGFPLNAEAYYYVGKHSNGYLVILPVKQSLLQTLDDKLRTEGRLN